MGRRFVRPAWACQACSHLGEVLLLSTAVALTLGIVSPVANSTSSFLIHAPSFAQVKVYPTGEGPNAVAIGDLTATASPTS